MDPLFLTHKLSVNNLSSNINIYDFQLRDHFLNTSNLYTLTCQCTSHKHNKSPCIVVSEPMCIKCQKPTKILLPYQAAMFHANLSEHKLARCSHHIHTHSPPCNRCINCQINLPCIVADTFQCDVSTAVVCPTTKKFTTQLCSDTIIPHEHIYNLKMPIFYICKDHVHRHKTYSQVDCIIQTQQCCANAINVRHFNECFSITTTIMSDDRRKILKTTEYTIFDPTIWRDQSFNHFMSFIRAIISSPDVVNERYKRYESSNFSISNIKKYKSGKESIIRTDVTGFETQGLYQTATISCTLPYYAMVLPQKLYDILQESNFDLDLVLTKRDPSLLQTCMYINAVIRNPDPNSEVVIISDQQSKGLNQDQDGDKNAVYPLLRVINGYDATQSFKYKVARIELAASFRKKSTLIATPRYLLSETSLLLIERNQELLANYGHEASREFFRKTHKYGIEFMNEAAAGYYQTEYNEFQKTLIDIIKTKEMSFITIDDILLNTSKLPSIILSTAKGSKQLLYMLLNNVSSNEKLADRKTEMIDLNNKYIMSSQDLSINGRKQFNAQFAAHDMISFHNFIYINKVLYADFSNFASTGVMLFNVASLKCFVNDLLELEDDDDEEVVDNDNANNDTNNENENNI